MLAPNAHEDEFLAAVESDNMDSVKQHFESHDVRDTTARWNTAHRARRLGQLRPGEMICNWGAYLLAHGHVEVVRWLFRREQLHLLGETLRQIVRYEFYRSLGDAKIATFEIFDVLFESPLFNEVMDYHEGLEMLSNLLTTAAGYGSSRWVSVLLAYGADPNLKGLFHTPLEIVPHSGDRETLDVLLAHGAWLEGTNLLTQRTSSQGRPLVGDMLRRGADANSGSARGGSVLHHASSHCIRGTVQSLIYDGFADIDARGSFGRTPLMVVGAEARESEHEITSLLVDAGADVHAVDNELGSVLHYAVGQRRVACLPLLLEQGADPNHRDAKGQTPMVALMARVQTRVNDIERTVLTLLLQAGADPFLEDHAGNSAPRLLDRSEIGRAFMREKHAFFRRALSPIDAHNNVCAAQRQ